VFHDVPDQGGASRGRITLTDRRQDGELGVRVPGGGVHPEEGGEVVQSRPDREQLIELLLVAARLLLGGSDIGHEAGHDAHVVGVAAHGGGTGADVLPETAGALGVPGDGEDTFGVGRGKVPARLRDTGLEDHRLLLGRGGGCSADRRPGTTGRGG
jgi:hypothetical protein